MLDDIRRLRSLFASDTTELPDIWLPFCPATGHCHVASIILFRRHGGRILRGDAHGRQGRMPFVHYWNDIDGFTVDVTRDQFSDNTWFTGVLDATGEPLNQTTLDKLALLERRFAATALSI
jgi:hypothetical protein